MDITAKHAAPDKDGVRIAELDEENFRLASDLELEIQHLTEELRDLYNDYQKNLF